MSRPTSTPQEIIVVGSGIIGLCTSYYLLTSPLLPPSSRVTLIENSSTIAPGASSFAGGLIAGGKGEDWQGAPSRSLAKLSWELHLELVERLRGRETYGWRECGAVGLRVGGGETSMSAYRTLPGGRKEVVEGDWLEGERQDMTGEGGIGQLDPAQFCQTLYEHLKTLGLRTFFGDLHPSPTPQHLLLDTPSNPSLHLPYTSLIIAAGPWSATLCAHLSLPSIPLTNLPGHSLLIRPSLSTVGLSGSTLPAEAVFAGLSGSAMGVHAATGGVARALTREEREEGFTRSPEFFPRADGSVYVAGENSIPSVGGGESAGLPNRLPEKAEEVKKLLDPKLVERLINSAGAVSKALDVKRGAVIEKQQFCYRPITPDGEPLIGELKPGVFVATGHGPWGITLAPATGKIISEIVLAPAGTKPVLSADVSGLGLERFAGVAKL